MEPTAPSALQILTECGQTALIEEFKNRSVEDQQRLADQLADLNKTYPGGLKEYVSRAKQLLIDSKNGLNPFLDYTPSVPTGETVDPTSEHFHELESLGVKQFQYSGFVLVAGGLGERLGFSSIKVGLPTNIVEEELVYMRYYCEMLLAYEERARESLDPSLDASSFNVPLCIMTSGDTHALTLQLFAENGNFGLKNEQLTIVKQEKVPALLDNEASFAFNEKDFLLETKPHGHGDVHTLLYQHGVVQRWLEAGKRWVVFFQDTNGSAFRAMPSALGLSSKREFEVNMISVARKPGDAVGGICTLKNDKTGDQMTVNVEYNQLDPLLRSKWNENGDVADENGLSHFPGNINVLIFRLEPFVANLKETGGLIPEFVNPKYADATKTKFKSATRLECMMQDYLRLLSTGSKVGFACYERWMSFSAVKNNIKEAAAKFKGGNAPECASSGEFDFYDTGARLLELAGVKIERAQEKTDFGGIEYAFGPKIVLHPSFGVTVKEI